jgi:hypothetical protein
MGVPNDSSFQRRVLLAALNLFDAKNGPVLEDFPEDAPVSDGKVTALSCPVNFAQTDVTLSKMDQLCSAFKKEMVSLRPWYDLAVQKRGRTTYGVSRIELDDLDDFMCFFLKGEVPENPRDDIALPYTLNLATDDLKAYYFEAITAQPDQDSPSSESLSDWFYNDTLAGKVLLTLRDICKKSDDGLMKILGTILIIPAAQMAKTKK